MRLDESTRRRALHTMVLVHCLNNPPQLSTYRTPCMHKHQPHARALYTGSDSPDASTREEILQRLHTRTHRHLLTDRPRSHMQRMTSSDLAHTCDGFSTHGVYPRYEHSSIKHVRIHTCTSTPHYRVKSPEGQPAARNHSGHEHSSTGTLEIKNPYTITRPHILA